MKRGHILALAGICFLLALLPRLYYVDWGLPQRFPADEASQVENAYRMLGADLNPHFFRYPSLQIYLLAATYLPVAISGESLDGPYRYLHARVLNALMGAGTAVLLFFLLRSLYSVLPALAGAVFLALHPTHLELSRYATVDVPLLFWVLIMLLLLLRAQSYEQQDMGKEQARKSRWRLLSFAGMALGLAMSTKYSAIFFLPLFAAGSWFSLRSMVDPHASTRRKNAVRVAGVLSMLALIIGLLLLILRSGLLQYAAAYTTDGIVETEYEAFVVRVGIAGLVASVALFMLSMAFRRLPSSHSLHRLHHPRYLLLLLLPFLVFILSSPFDLLDWPHALRDILYEYRHMNIGSAAHYPVGGEVHEMFAPEKLAFASLSFYLDWLRASAGYVFLLLLPAGAVLAVLRRQWYLLSLLATVLLYGMVISSWGNQAVRYALPLLPLLLIIALYPLCVLYQSRFRTLRYTIFLASMALPLVPVLASSGYISQLRVSDTRSLALEWLLQQGAEGADIALDDKTLDLAFVPVFGSVRTSSSSVLMDMSVEELESRRYRYIVLRDLPDIIAPSDERRRILTAQYQLRRTLKAEKGSSRGPRLYMYEARP